MTDDLVVVHTFPNEVAAHVARVSLDAHGIEAILLSDDAGGMLPTLQFLHGVRLAVRRADAELARRVLQAIDEPSGTS